MPVTTLAANRVDRAHDLAREVLAALPRRWRHTVGVAARAGEVAATLPPADGAVLVAAAWLHDIGYAAEIAHTGFHPLDGAAFLERCGWPERITALVAHHSGAAYLAPARGLGPALNRYHREVSAVADGLIHADQTTGTTGERLPVDLRMADMLRRHGPDSAHARVHPVRGPYLRAAVTRTERRLARWAVPEALPPHRG